MSSLGELGSKRKTVAILFNYQIFEQRPKGSESHGALREEFSRSWDQQQVGENIIGIFKEKQRSKCISPCMDKGRMVFEHREITGNNMIF